MNLDPTFTETLRGDYEVASRKRFQRVRYGIVSMVRVGRVFNCCCDVVKSKGYVSRAFVLNGHTTRDAFGEYVKERYVQRYGFDPLTWLLIAKLVLLFIELFIKFSSGPDHG